MDEIEVADIVGMYAEEVMDGIKLPKGMYCHIGREQIRRDYVIVELWQRYPSRRGPQKVCQVPIEIYDGIHLKALGRMASNLKIPAITGPSLHIGDPDFEDKFEMALTGLIEQAEEAWGEEWAQ